MIKQFIFSLVFIFICLVSIGAEQETFGEKASDAVSTVYNDGKQVVTTVYSDGKDLLKTVYPEVKDAVVAIASAIGVAAEHVYTVLVKKYVVEGVAQLLIFVGSIILLIFGVRGVNKFINTESVITWKVLFPVAFSIVGLIMLFNVNYNNMLMGIINPEYGAINYIIEYTQSMMH